MYILRSILGVSIVATLGACGSDAGTDEDITGTLKQVWERDELVCGINGAQLGFSSLGSDGVMRGLDSDYCRALAAAVGVGNIEFVPLSAEERLDAVRDGRVDVLSRTTTWTFSRDNDGLEFVGTIFYDGEGFLVKAVENVTTIEDFPDPNFCILTATTSRANIESYFSGQEVVITEYASEEARMEAFLADECNVYTYDRSALVGVRLELANPEDFAILDNVISKEPLSPVVSDDDPQWADIARWTLFALINAEELGITSANAESLLDTEDAEIRRFLGADAQNLAETLELTPDWAYQIVLETGNYGEIFERNLGQDSDLKMARGLNGLWVDGGLMYAPPIK